MRIHRTTVLFPAWDVRRVGYRMPEISKQARFLVRQAVALAGAGIPYELEWGNKKGDNKRSQFAGFGATLTVRDAEMPAAKPLPREAPRKIAGGWKPKMWDAEYKLDAYATGTPVTKSPGFVIAHSCGLSMVRPSSTGEWDASEDCSKGWLLIHTASGTGFGLELNFTKCQAALLMAASYCDWNGELSALRKDITVRKAYSAVKVAYGSGNVREFARRELERFKETEQAQAQAA